MKKLILPIAKSALATEIAALPPENLFVVRGDYEVYLSRLDQNSELLREIGRLRELTFREVGEGTGNALDIDDFDQYYFNLFIWDKKNRQIVGGYRIGPGDIIFDKYGIDHFYIHSLFEIDEGAYPMLKQALELGRSYIVADYQRSYLPFFLLWQGILTFLMRNPHYQYLIGPVSISKYYSGVSKSLIVAFVKRYFFDEAMARFFQARTPFQAELAPVNLDAMLNTIEGKEIKDLETFLNSIEPQHIKVPVLLRQYTKLNARFISFNIDPHFSDALDGLMVLDLRQLPSEVIELLNEK